MTKRATTKKLAGPRTGQVNKPEKQNLEPVVEIYKAGAKGRDGEPITLLEKPITFFSRYREDQIVIEQARTEQVGPTKWITIPAKICAFRDRAFVTNDQEKVDFIRKHPRYGLELFEFGNDKHKARIDMIDDSGRILELERQGKLARIMESRMRKGLDS